MCFKFQSLLAIVAFLTFCPITSYAQSIEVPLILTISINGTTPGGEYYNPNLPPSQFAAESDLEVLVSNKSKKSQDYLIYGALYTNCGMNASGRSCNRVKTATAQVTPLTVTMFNGSSQIKVNLEGRIGRRKIRSTPRVIRFQKKSHLDELPWIADIEIVGDVDESTIDINDVEGDYTGTFQITAVIL